MEVLARFGTQEGSTGKLRAQAPTPISCSDWDTVHFEPSAKEEKVQKGLVGYADEDSVAVAQSGRKKGSLQAIDCVLARGGRPGGGQWT